MFGGGRGASVCASLVLAVVVGPAFSSPVLGLPTSPQPAGAADVPVADDAPARQTETEAREYAAQLGRPVEILAFRGESRDVFANPDGTTTTDEYAQPVRVLRDGTWVDVDPNLTALPDGSVVPRATTLDIRLSGGGSPRAPLITVNRAGRTMTLDWSGTLREPRIEGQSATYSEVLPGADLVVTVDVAGFSHVLVVKTPEAAADVAELDFPLSTDGMRVVASGDGGLDAVDEATSGVVLESTDPLMWDSGVDSDVSAGPRGLGRGRVDPAAGPLPTAQRARIGVRVERGHLKLIPDRKMLTSRNTRWPVYIDPMWDDTRNSGWAMVAKGYPNEEYWKFKNDEGVGECPVSSGWCEGVLVKRLFYALPTAPFHNRTILDAKFKVTMTDTYNSSAKDVQIYRSGTISRRTNWGNQPDLIDHLDTKAPTGTKSHCTDKNQNVSFTVTDAVKMAVKEKWATTTFGLRAKNENDHEAWKRFCGNAVLSVHHNRPPAQPAQSTLRTSPGGKCVSGSDRPHVNKLPTLHMVLKDPDDDPPRRENVRGEIFIEWTRTDGSKESRTVWTPWKASGSPFQATVPSGIPRNTVIGWSVRAHDGKTPGPWSWEGDKQTGCHFVYDTAAPDAPDIDSPEYLPGDEADTTSDCVQSAQAHGSPGVYGTFTFDAPGSEAVRYEYGFDTDPSPNNTLKPQQPGGPVSVPWMPDREGTHFVEVTAYDKAGNASGTASCMFLVDTRAAVAEWALDDPAGAQVAADARGGHPAARGPEATFGVPGPACPPTPGDCGVDRAVRLSGNADGYLSTTRSVVDTSTAYSVAAWVRLTDAGKDAAAVSQDGDAGPGFTLGYQKSSKKWAFSVPAKDINGAAVTVAVSSAPASVGKWTHLAATYDPVKRTFQLFVNGGAQPPLTQATPWRAGGAAQIGRARAGAGYGQHWSGDIADVALFDRIVVPREIADLSRLRPIRQAYWPLDEATDDSSPEYNGDQDMELSGGARIHVGDLVNPPAALMGRGDLRLDGIDDYAATEQPAVTTDASFTVTARVRLAALPQRPMTVVSHSGKRASALIIRCTADRRWQLALATADTDGNASVTAVDNEALASTTSAGQHLALVYNAFTNEALLYVDGQLSSAQAVHSQTWRASGGLQLGRALIDGAWGEHFAGVIDDVRVYSGVADATLVQRLSLSTPQPAL